MANNSLPALSMKPWLMEKTLDMSLLKEKIAGYEWNEEGINYEKILQSYLHTGFQATNFGMAVKELDEMIGCRKAAIPVGETLDDQDSLYGVKNNCTIFLGYTSSIVTCGLRETIRFLVEHKMVDCIVTAAGGIEEDFMKCLSSSYVGNFCLNDCDLRNNGINRAANILVPNDNYSTFEKWFVPILQEMLEEQKKGTVWTPSKIIYKLGEKIDNKKSIYYWAAKNNIPVFCPAFTDGFLGDILYGYSEHLPDLLIDIASDVRLIDQLAEDSFNTGQFIIGGGVVKHHVSNANAQRTGADYSVYINTAAEYDGSDTGAPPHEAKSWGKIKKEARPVKVFAEATLVLPLLVAQTFAKDHFEGKRSV